MSLSVEGARILSRRISDRRPRGEAAAVKTTICIQNVLIHNNIISKYSVCRCVLGYITRANTCITIH